MQRTLKHSLRTMAAVLALGLGTVATVHGEENAMWYQCKYCGHKARDVASLTGSACQRHPDGPGNGRHALYEGGTKTSYTCKWCGKRSPDIASLTSSKCQRHPAGPAAGRHEPAL